MRKTTPLLLLMGASLMLASCGGASGLKEVTASEFKEAASGFDLDTLVAAIETFEYSMSNDGEIAYHVVVDVKDETYLYMFMSSGDDAIETLVFLEEGKDTYTISISSSASSSPTTQSGIPSSSVSSTFDTFTDASALEPYTLPYYLDDLTEEQEEGTTIQYYTGDGYEIVATYEGEGESSFTTLKFNNDGYLSSESASYSCDATESDSAYSGAYEISVTINQEIQKKTSL